MGVKQFYHDLLMRFGLLKTGMPVTKNKKVDQFIDFLVNEKGYRTAKSFYDEKNFGNEVFEFRKERSAVVIVKDKDYWHIDFGFVEDGRAFTSGEYSILLYLGIYKDPKECVGIEKDKKLFNAIKTNFDQIVYCSQKGKMGPGR